MVEDDDTGAAVLDRAPGIGSGHDAFEAELSVPLPHHLSHIIPVHRWVKHLREIAADRECATAHVDVLVELRQLEPLVRGVVDPPPGLDRELQPTGERHPEWYRKAGA